MHVTKNSKGQLAMREKILTRKLFIVLLGIFLLSQSTQTFTQDKRVVRKPKLKVVKLPSGYKNVVVHGKNYHYHKGVFYKKSRAGFVAVRSPIGARIGMLPMGYLTVRTGGVMYYHYYDTYYRYDPVHKVYIVIEKPEEVHSSTMDEIALVNGDILEGLYLGGTRSTVQIEIDREIMEIPVEEIISITFAPSFEK